MKVVVRLVPSAGQEYELGREKVDWPEDWPLPREGEEVALPHLPERLTGGKDTFFVRHVIWHPQGDRGTPPYVYLALGSRRPQ